MTVVSSDVFWVNLDPIEGSEMVKTRPCVVISPNEMNDYLRTVTIAPLTTNLRLVHWRVQVFCDGQHGRTLMVAAYILCAIRKKRMTNYPSIIGNLLSDGEKHHLSGDESLTEKNKMTHIFLPFLTFFNI